MRRTFSLPLATLTLGAGTGCSPSIEGTWDITSYTLDGSRYYLPQTEVDGAYTYTYSGLMEFEDNGDAELVLSYSYTYQGATQTEASVYSGTWEKAGAVFTVEVENYDLECEVDGTDMSCAGESTGSSSIPVEFELTLQGAD